MPGFAARRGWHGNKLNEQNYGDTLTPATAVFPYNAHGDGAMAKFLHSTNAKPAHSPDGLRGRARQAPDFYKFSKFT